MITAVVIHDINVVIQQHSLPETSQTFLQATLTNILRQSPGTRDMMTEAKVKSAIHHVRTFSDNPQGYRDASQ